MSDREEVCWFIGGILSGLLVLICSLGHFICKGTAIEADARMEVAQEIGGAFVGGLAEVGKWWKD